MKGRHPGRRFWGEGISGTERKGKDFWVQMLAGGWGHPLLIPQTRTKTNTPALGLLCPISSLTPTDIPERNQVPQSLEHDRPEGSGEHCFSQPLPLFTFAADKQECVKLFVALLREHDPDLREDQEVHLIMQEVSSKNRDGNPMS